MSNKSKSHPAIEKFKADFFGASEPLTDVMIRISKNEFIRMSNLDFKDKNYVLVN